MQLSYHKRSRRSKGNQQPPVIPGGVYTITPLAAVSVWSALKLKLVSWYHLRAWIALYEVRTWRDTSTPAQRNLFRFTPRLMAQALGNKRAGPRIKRALADLERLGLARLTPTDLWFTASLDDLPPELQVETKRILKTLGNASITRAIRMPRRLMRHILRSRSRPLRAALIFAILLRIMPVKRYGWYKGCLTTALLAEVSGFSESRIKHERAALIMEGYFGRLDTPARVRQQHGDWYALARHLPTPSELENRPNQQPPRPPKLNNQQPPTKEPVPSSGMETNQFLPRKPGASRSISTPDPTAAPSWHHIRSEDLRQPQRRIDLYRDACTRRIVTGGPAQKLMFFSAIARARRLGSRNPCGMLRRIVETAPYQTHIADCDEEQARAWLAEDQPPDPDIAAASSLLRRITATPTCFTGERSDDSILASHLIRRLQKEGFPTRDAFNLIMTTEVGRTNLAGWTQDRWNRATAIHRM